MYVCIYVYKIELLILNFASDMALRFMNALFLYEKTSIQEINCGYCIEISGKFNVFLSEDISATDAASLMLKAFNEHADVQDVSVIELLKGRKLN